MKVPVTLGHEYSGIVEALGEGVTQFKVGDRVMGESNQYCGYCSNCHKGLTNICLNNKMTGLHIDGGMAEYISVPEKIVHKLPDNISFEEAAVAQPCAVSFHGVFDNSRIRPADAVVVFGPGIVGLMAAQGAKIMGARQVVVIGTNVDEGVRLPIAKKMGFSVINIEKQNLKQELLALTGSQAADVVVECSGAAQAIPQALDIVRKGGAITFIGIYSRPAEIFLTPLIRNEVQISTSYTCTWENYEQALQLIGSGQVDLKPLIAIYPFEEGLKAFVDGLAKIVLKPVLTL
jgi:L-iditol 2-dehydrogenase